MGQFTYEFTPNARKSLKKLPQQIQVRIINKLNFYCKQKEPQAFASRLSNFIAGQYRFRIGKYRVIFDLDQSKNLLTIHEIGHRSTIYR